MVLWAIRGTEKDVNSTFSVSRMVLWAIRGAGKGGTVSFQFRGLPSGPFVEPKRWHFDCLVFAALVGHTWNWKRCRFDMFSFADGRVGHSRSRKRWHFDDFSFEDGLVGHTWS